MIRRLSYCLLAALVLGFSCTREPEKCDSSAIEITVRCGDPILSKADEDDTQDGENRYNENLISTVDFFFYPGEEPDRDADAVFHVRRNSGLRGSDVFLLDLTPEDINSRIFPNVQTSGIDIRKATVFAVVNYPGLLVLDEGDLSGTSLNALEAIERETDFVQTPPDSYPNLAPQNYKQESFLMSGITILSLRSRTSNIAATGAINLARFASKLTVSVKVAESVTLGESVWEPMLENMAIYLVNGVNTVTLGGEDPTPQYFSYESNKKRFAFIDTSDGDKIKPLVGKTGEYYNSHPMYMYPQHWTYGETKESTYAVEPYLKLELPWHRISGGVSTQKQCYYKIFIPDDIRGEGYIRHFVRNSWYHMEIEVGLLGADTDDAAVELTGSYFLVPWQNVDREIERQADIGSARYLSVDKTQYELHNVESVDMRYTTSHPLDIEDIRATCPYYGEAKSGRARGGSIRQVTTDDDIYPNGSYYILYNESDRKAMNGGEDWLTDTGNAIRFSRPLRNELTDTDFDYSPYTVAFTIVHSDRKNDERYRKAITVTQIPAITIESMLNSDDTFVRTDHFLRPGQYVYASEHWGYVYVDGRQIVRANAAKNEQGEWVETPTYNDKLNDTYMDYFRSQYPDDPDVQAFGKEDFHWRVIWYTGGSLDLFKIDTTVPPEGSDLVIGDPRTDEPDPDYLDKFKVADVIGGGAQRSLTWYYPAEKSARTANMMAPSYRISSKCSGTEFGSITEEQAKYRCATFQEDGYPAGRWRLPTKGEIHFIAQLSANGAFTRLFSNNSVYWSANGAIRVEEGGTVTDESSATIALTRCVYDVWYWGDERPEELVSDRAHFYWGDAER